MRTIQRVRASTSKVGYLRVGSLLMLGALVWVLWSAARDASNWKWLTEFSNEQAAAKSKRLTVGMERQAKLSAVVAAQEVGTRVDPAPPAGDPAAGEESFKQENPAVNPPSEYKPAFEDDGKSGGTSVKSSEYLGPTDLDDDQQDAFEEEGQAISDGGLDLRKEEMPAYWRMFLWVKNQTPAQMLKRPTTKIRLDDMLQRPDKVRGKLVKLELHVTRVLSYDVASENIAGVKKVYELWGWSDETKAWLYCGVTPELPDKMPLGSDLHERVTFVGYFLKVQGYLAANSRPNDRPLSSPLLVGRVIWHPEAPPSKPSVTEPYWIWGSIGVAAVLLIGGSAYPFLRRTPARESLLRESSAVRTDLNAWATKPQIESDTEHHPSPNPFNPN